MNINRIDPSLDYLDDSLSYLNLAIIDNEFVAAISLVNIEKQITALDSSIQASKKSIHMLTYKFKRKYQRLFEISDIFLIFFKKNQTKLRDVCIISIGVRG